MPDSLQERTARIEHLVRHVESVADDETRSSVVELMRAVMELHGTGLARLLEVAAEEPQPGSPLIQRLAADDLVSSLLLLHNLHPDELPVRVSKALEKVRPFLKSHGGDVELLGINDSGFVRLRLQGSCHGCPSSSMTLKIAIEESLDEFAPDRGGLEIAGVIETMPPGGFIPAEALKFNGVAAWNGSSTDSRKAAPG